MIKNEMHSTFNQILIDAMTACPELSDKINEFKNLFGNEQIHKIDEIFNRHQYPSGKIVYSRVANIETCPDLQQLFKLSTDAYAIFNYLITMNKSPNNLVYITLRSKKKDVIDVCNLQYMSNIKIDAIRKAIKILIEYDFIRVYEQHKGTTPTLYMLNPKYCQVGKSDTRDWDKLDKGLAKFDNVQAYQIQLIPLVRQDAYYDNNDNETIYNRHLKASNIIIPNPEIETLNIINRAHYKSE